jgi:hypothetical protein
MEKAKSQEAQYKSSVQKANEDLEQFKSKQMPTVVDVTQLVVRIFIKLTATRKMGRREMEPVTWSCKIVCHDARLQEFKDLK